MAGPFCGFGTDHGFGRIWIGEGWPLIREISRVTGGGENLISHTPVGDDKSITGMRRHMLAKTPICLVPVGVRGLGRESVDGKCGYQPHAQRSEGHCGKRDQASPPEIDQTG